MCVTMNFVWKITTLKFLENYSVVSNFGVTINIHRAKFLNWLALRLYTLLYVIRIVMRNYNSLAISVLWLEQEMFILFSCSNVFIYIRNRIAIAQHKSACARVIWVCRIYIKCRQRQSEIPCFRWINIQIFFLFRATKSQSKWLSIHKTCSFLPNIHTPGNRDNFGQWKFFGTFSLQKMLSMKNLKRNHFSNDDDDDDDLLLVWGNNRFYKFFPNEFPHWCGKQWNWFFFVYEKNCY